METITISSNKKQELIDITDQINQTVRKSGVKEGICIVFAQHATCGIIINENYDPNICVDFLKIFNKSFPNQAGYLHDKIDNNAGAHIKATITGPSESIPIKNGKLYLGTWQSVMLADFDGPKKRKIIVNIIRI